MMLQVFTDIIDSLSNIPISVLADPLVKQIALHGYEENHFRLFEKIIKHPRLNSKDAMLITHLFGKIAIHDIDFSQKAILFICNLLKRFSDDKHLQVYSLIFFYMFSVFIHSYHVICL